MTPKCLLLVLTYLTLGASNVFALQPCQPWPAINGDGIGPFNYKDRAQLNWLKNVEANHFDDNVRSLRKGQSSAHVGADLHYVLHRFPNHHPALQAMMRLAERQRKDRPGGAVVTVECYLYRAAVFAPQDPIVKSLYGMYLSKVGKRKDALEQMTMASKLRPGDGNIHYNLGLLYFDEKDYDKAKEHAKRAYDLGFPLPGLRKKLESVGAWEG